MEFDAILTSKMAVLFNGTREDTIAFLKTRDDVGSLIAAPFDVNELISAEDYLFLHDGN